MPKGDNKVTINFTTEMKQFGDGMKGDLYLSFYTALCFLQQNKEEFIAKYGQECYEAHIKRFSRPAIEVRNDSAQRKKDALVLKRRELEVREKELEIKSKFLQAETTVMNDKHQTKEEEKLLKNPDYLALIKEKRDIEANIRYIETKEPKPLSDYKVKILSEYQTRLAEVNQKIAQLRKVNDPLSRLV
jgi:hypothetical protein